MNLRVAEVEQRLQLLRRRINLFRVQHAVYLAGSLALLMTALLVVAAVHASPSAFRLALWVSMGAAVVCVAGVFLAFARWRADLQEVARLADRVGGLADRLSTVLHLRRMPGSILWPVLVNQVMDLGDRWRPERIAPRRVPRSVLVLAASLLLLISAVVVQRRSGDVLGGGAQSQLAERQQPPKVESARESPPPPRAHSGGVEANVGDEVLTALGDDAVPAHSFAYDAALQGASGSQEGARLSELPDRLQDAIRRALHPQPLDAPRLLGAGAGRQIGTGGADGSRQDFRVHREAERGSAPSAAAHKAQEEASQVPAPGLRPHRQDKDRSQQAEPRHAGAASNAGRSGSSPRAGDGPAAEPALGSVADLGSGASQAPTFKLTLHSFLAAVERQGPSQREVGGVSSAKGREESGMLSERQLDDDLMRRSDIPAQYEEVVRRAYSVGK